MSNGYLFPQKNTAHSDRSGQGLGFFLRSCEPPLDHAPDLGFRILSPPDKNRMYAGQLIEYKVRPLPGWSVYWMTEITHVEEGRYFVDEQRFGPYRLWHHQHHFKAIEGGVEMTDIVHYKMPFLWLGDLANSLFVRSQLEKIFNYRFEKVGELFGK